MAANTLKIGEHADRAEKRLPRCRESVVLITCDKNVQKWNCIVLFKFNGKFNIAMTAVQIVQKVICTVFVVEHGECVINVTIPK